MKVFFQVKTVISQIVFSYLTCFVSLEQKGKSYLNIRFFFMNSFHFFLVKKKKNNGDKEP